MSDTLLERIRQRPSTATLIDPAVVDDAEVIEDLGVFGWLRGVKEQALMLELRLKNGNVVAVSYAYLERAELDPGEGITLHLGAGKVVRITGRNLDAEPHPRMKLFDGIIRHRVPWLRESELSDAVNDRPFIERILTRGV